MVHSHLTNQRIYLKKKMNLPQQFLKNTYILTNKFNISGVGLFFGKVKCHCADTDKRQRTK